MNKAILINLVVAVVAIIAIVILSQSTNDTLQSKCEAQGGQYYRSIDAAKSLCEVK